MATPPELPAANVDPLELLVGGITQPQAKKFNDAILALVDRAWAESITSLLESSWTSSMSHPCNLFQAHPARTQLNQLGSSSSTLHPAQFQLMSLFSTHF
ncbi:hypothetical protein J1N35_037554 [Gossypium stocksii]|uniref:Uncharacterized protein n=1 Tax=Gossypium stocksii TaxID=47602 RepID=A0A9D3UKQ8_9ROSI|nr:hypothetical protein J1N35_037554 [Gossypium stocksii]